MARAKRLKNFMANVTRCLLLGGRTSPPKKKSDTLPSPSTGCQEEVLVRYFSDATFSGMRNV